VGIVVGVVMLLLLAAAVLVVRRCRAVNGHAAGGGGLHVMNNPAFGIDPNHAAAIGMMVNPMHAPPSPPAAPPPTSTPPAASAATPTPTTSASASAPPPSNGFYGTVDKNFFDRVVPTDGEHPDEQANPLADLDQVEDMSFRQTVRVAEARCGPTGTIDAAEAFADQYIQQQQQQQPHQPPSPTIARDGIAAMHAYTQDSKLYAEVNAAAGGWGANGRDWLPDFLPYIKLLLGATMQLPREECTLYRGVLVPADELLGDLGVGDVLTWWSFTSATTSPDVLQAEAFMGFGKAGVSVCTRVCRTHPCIV